tara:strand:- start:1108 stop:1389 length:282 start_codon:yes stop_codon:yes gene_type:complete
MKVREIMEKAGIRETGRAISYIKDALDELNLISETHVETARYDIVEGQRFYDIPNEAVKIIDIRCKNQGNTSGNYQTIPRSMYEPETKDSDGV